MPVGEPRPLDPAELARGRRRRKMLIEGDGRARILIADDDAQIRSILRELLGEAYECREVSSAEEALELLRVERFHLVLSDITMGGISGLEMIPHVLRRAPDTVVVMISGEQTIESAITAMRAGAFDYVTKPFDLDHVEAAVRRALEHHALRAAKRHYEAHLEELVEARTAELRRANTELRREVGERRRAEEKIVHMAYHDALTELPNQALFKDRLTQELSTSRGEGRKTAVIFLAVDRLKKVNDTLGYAAGDALLRGVARLLAGRVRQADTAAYFGGNEFALLLTRVGGAEEAAKFAEGVREALRRPLDCGGRELYVTASFGVSLCPDDGEDCHTLLKNAAAALYRAKQKGGDAYEFFTPDMHERALKRLSLENDLRRALEREEFEVHYQPRVEAASGRVVGMEALARWRHPELGLVSPAEFIPVAEETGMIGPLGERVLRTACAQNGAWREGGLGPLRVGVNLSLRQFQQPDLIQMVERTLAETGLDAGGLELELTESSMMHDAAHAVETLRRLKATGIKISVDDFGSGYSSLSYLKHLPLDVLKIDLSFVRDMAADQNNAAIVKAIITLAHSLGLTAVAEGVETEEQAALLRRMGCDEMQGYLFSRPLPAADFERFLRGRPGASPPSRKPLSIVRR
jgi:diguanylate cyclase